MLGAVLFNMFMNDLVYLIKNCDLSTYDDDTQIFAAETEPVKLQEVINTDLAAIDRWYDANGMKRNHLKYQALVMGNLQTPKPKFHCDNTTIPVSEDLTLLGVSIDNKQKFDKQIANVTRKVSQHLAVVKRLRNILPLDMPKNVYQSFIASHFDYSSDVWHFYTKTASDRLEKVNERSLCFVLKDKSSSYTELLKKL